VYKYSLYRQYPGQRLGSESSITTTCRVQSIFTHGTPPLSVTATLTVVIQLWCTLSNPSRFSIGGSNQRFPLSYRLCASLAAPYFVFFIFILTGIALVQQMPDSVRSNGLFCSIYVNNLHKYAVSIYCASVMLVIMGFEVAIAVRYYRLRAHINRAFPLADRQGPSLSMVLRVGTFSFYSLICFSAAIIVISGKLSDVLYIIQAALPLVTVLVFGTQKDMLLAWQQCKWRRTAHPCTLHVTEGPVAANGIITPPGLAPPTAVAISHDTDVDTLTRSLPSITAMPPPTFVDKSKTDPSKLLVEPPFPEQDDSEGSTLGSDLTLDGARLPLQVDGNASSSSLAGSEHRSSQLDVQIPQHTHVHRISWHWIWNLSRGSLNRDSRPPTPPV
jgi:hypothetical protein